MLWHTHAQEPEALELHACHLAIGPVSVYSKVYSPTGKLITNVQKVHLYHSDKSLSASGFHK